MTRTYLVDDSSRVGEIRRAAAAMVREEGLGEAPASNVALVANEICTNLLKHAGNGEVLMSTLSDRGGPGIEILAIDRGPGMTDVSRCLADGYSSANTQGTGLGAIARLSQEFDIHSERGKGTVLVARVRLPGAARTLVGAVLMPMRGEEASGDAWAFRTGKSGTTLIVADGLGHGVLAARASTEAIAAFRRSSDFLPMPILQQVHSSLRPTRGAAVAVSYADRDTSTVRYAGIGNIAGVIAGVEKPLMMISHNGTAGYGSPRFQEFSYPWKNESLLVMHSDGLRTNWSLEDYPGLRRRDPSIIAGILYRDHSRGRDDVCVVVSRVGEAA